MSNAPREFIPDGKRHRNNENMATHVTEARADLGLNVTYLRFDDGAIAVRSEDKKGVLTIAHLDADGTVMLFNNQLKEGGVIPDESKASYAATIRDLVNGAFPVGANAIVPLAARKSGDAAKMKDFSTLNALDADTVTYGDSVDVYTISGTAVFVKHDAQRNITDKLFSVPGAIRYNAVNVDDQYEPIVRDSDNTTPNASSLDNRLLAVKIVADGDISLEEAKEIGAAMQRGKNVVANAPKRSKH